MLPQVILTFANRAEGKQGFLRSLRREQREIEAALRPAAERLSPICRVDSRADVTRARLVEHLQSAAAAQFAVVFHYGGHASGSALALRHGDVPAQGVAALLSSLPRLHMVFLNGCSTQAQVDALLDGGVPVVVATRADVKDAAATDFAAHFYLRLGEGSTIQRAFDDAVVAVQTLHTVFTASREPSKGSARFTPKKPPAAAGVPWQLWSRRAPGAMDPCAWSLPLAADDPLFTLPQPQVAVPAEPFRGAASYRVEDAAIFRGRGAEIEEAYSALTDGAAAVVVMHGPAGVGRTSMVQAGLLSRLRVDRAACAVVPETLDDAQSAAPEVLLVDEAERLTEAQIQAALAMSPRVLFAVRSAQVEALTAAIDQAGHAVTSVPLGHLNEAAITCVIRDVTRIFGFSYAADLPQRLAADLAGHGAVDALSAGLSGALVDAGEVGGLPEQGYGTPSMTSAAAAQPVVGATTPITSAVLCALWVGRTDDEVDDAQYEQFKRDGCLDSFVRDGMAALAAENSEWVESGFALDLLAHHRTLLGKLRGHTLEGLKGRYAHREDVEVFVEAACVNRLLVQTPDGAGTLLAHDMLAPLIGSRFAHSRAPAQQARRIIEERLPSWAGGAEGATLDANDLLTIEAGRAGMAVLNADGLRMTEASARAVVAKARRRRILRSALGGALILVLTLAFLWNQRRLEVKHTKAEAAQLVDARDMAAGLVAAYRKLEDPTPQRAAAGVVQLAGLLEKHGTVAPAVARLALRSWSGILTAYDEAPDRLARPTVFMLAGRAHLVDRRGRFHPLSGAPSGWFVAPGGRWVAVIDARAQQLRLFDAQTGAAGPGDPFKVPGTIERVGQFDAPDVLLVLSNLQGSESLWSLLVIDTRDGRGQSALFEDTAWRGHCTQRLPLMRPPVGEDGVRLVFGADGRLEPATLRREEGADVRFDDCLKRTIMPQAPRSSAVSDLRPAWRRWTTQPLDDAARRAGLFGGPGEIPLALRDARSAKVGEGGCMEGCGFLAARHKSGVFAAGEHQLFIAREVCDLFGGSDWLTRWCRSDGRSGYMYSPDDIRRLNTGERPPPRRRGALVLFGGRLLDVHDLTPLKTSYAGAAWDFAMSPDGRRLALLTDRGLLHLVRKEDTFVEHRRKSPLDDPFLAVAWASDHRLIVQRTSGITAVNVTDDALLWRRPTAASRGGLAAGFDMVAVRTDDAIRLVAAADGTALSPLERPGLTAVSDLTMRFEPDGALVVHDDAQVLRRAPVPQEDATAQAGVDRWLAAHPDRVPPLTGDGPCSEGRALRDGECWPAP